MPFLKVILISLIMNAMSIGSVSPFYVQITTAKQYQVKAAFLYNFTQFVEWPENTFQHVDDPIIIGVVGEDPFGSYLDELVSGEIINGRPLTILRYKALEEIGNCHILYINVANKEKAGEIIKKTKGQSLLTVSDMNGFIQKGGMVRFITVDNKIKFQINPEASRSADLKISSKLLQLAEIVIPNFESADDI